MPGYRKSVKGRAPKRRTGGKSYKTRVLKEVTGGYQRLKDFERRVDIPIVINARGHYPVGLDHQALTQVEANAIGYSRLTADYPIAAGNPGGNFIRSYGASQSTLIPPGPTLANGNIGVLEPIKWLPQYRATDGSIQSYSAAQNPTATLGSPCAFMAGQRAMYGFLKFQLNFGYVCDNNQAADVPITARMCVVRLKGKLIDDMGDIRSDFSLLKPFPASTSKYQKLFDKSFTLQKGQTKQISQTIGLNSWLSRPAGIPNEGSGVTAAVTKHLADADFLGGCISKQVMDTSSGNNTRLECWREFKCEDTENDMDSTYNLETTRVVVLFMSSDDAIGGFSGSAAPTAGTGSNIGAANSPQLACVGYVRAVA